ncbi:cyclic nucleotide-gated ion channel [Lichenihabitans psoromatis]|uniref:cyclic nucleotide-gated ion channel n=1 Tax=Lichenihabitans psoromatis TaxID=2528642 RepID=UPI001035D366|nr:cyclic nucleotide-gated ion channel [Lichenihabitans psoromatis]
MSVATPRTAWFRARLDLHALFDEADTQNWPATIVRRGLIGLVLISVASIVLETVPDLAAAYGAWFLGIEDVAVAIFSIEYILRLWSAPEEPNYSGSGEWAARWAFARSLPALIDLISILPTIAGLILSAHLKIFLLLRLLRFFKLARYSPGMRSLAKVLEAERKALLASAIILLGFVILAAAAMYSAEHDAQPDKLGSIPAAMWWAIVTLTTVGYGDVYPITVVGRLVASVTMVFGLMMLALPVGIVATAFAEEIHRREFVVTWGMIARIPLFATLSASEIGEITRFLNARMVSKGTAVVRQGEDARSMFLIASGEVEVELPNGPVRLGEGHFFGERALLENSKRSATVRATETTRLLVLEASDLRVMMDRNPAIAQRIRGVAEQRQADNAKNEDAD